MLLYIIDQNEFVDAFDGIYTYPASKMIYDYLSNSEYFIEYNLFSIERHFSEISIDEDFNTDCFQLNR